MKYVTTVNDVSYYRQGFQTIYESLLHQVSRLPATRHTSSRRTPARPESTLSTCLSPL